MGLQMIEGWWWDSTEVSPPDQPTHPQSPAVRHMEMGGGRSAGYEWVIRSGVAWAWRESESRLWFWNRGWRPVRGDQHSSEPSAHEEGEIAPSHRHTTTTARFTRGGGADTVRGSGATLSVRLVINQQWAGQSRQRRSRRVRVLRRARYPDADRNATAPGISIT